MSCWSLLTLRKISGSAAMFFTLRRMKTAKFCFAALSLLREAPQTVINCSRGCSTWPIRTTASRQGRQSKKLGFGYNPPPLITGLYYILRIINSYFGLLLLGRRSGPKIKFHKPTYNHLVEMAEGQSWESAEEELSYMKRTIKKLGKMN